MTGNEASDAEDNENTMIPSRNKGKEVVRNLPVPGARDETLDTLGAVFESFNESYVPPVTPVPDGEESNSDKKPKKASLVSLPTELLLLLLEFTRFDPRTLWALTLTCRWTNLVATVSC
jgi:hypothetical protein